MKTITDKLKDINPILLALAAIWSVVALAVIIQMWAPQDPHFICCGTLDSDVAEAADFDELSSKRRLRKIWFAGGSPKGMTQEQFQADCMAGLDRLSSFTNTDFVRVDKSSGAYLRVYVFTNEQFWARWSDLRKSKTIPMARQQGNSVYWTDHNRAVAYVQACMIHEFGHRVGLKHVGDRTSIMHAHLPVQKKNAADRGKFRSRLGKERTE